MKNAVEKLITRSFRRLLDKGIHRGFITYEELAKSLGKRHYNKKNIEKAFLYIFDNKVALVQKKSDYRSAKKKESSQADGSKDTDLDKSDDPIRMYLREMGGVELLSREGEIAIAKRIEAGKNIMIGALSQSPLTAKKVFEWKDKLEKNELLVREIIDIDSTYVDTESGERPKVVKKNKPYVKKQLDNKSDKDLKEGEDNKEEPNNEEDEFNPSLAAMEEEIRPQVISTMDELSKNYHKLVKYQEEKLNCVLKDGTFSRSKDVRYKKIQGELVEEIKRLQISQSILAELVQEHYQENKKIISLEGALMREVVENNIPRNEFLKYYLGNEINPNLPLFLKENSAGKNFIKKKSKEFTEIRERLVELSQKIGLPVGEFKKLVSRIQKGEKGSKCSAGIPAFKLEH